MERDPFFADVTLGDLLIISMPIIVSTIGAVLMVTVGRRRSRIAICFAGIATAAAAISFGEIVEAWTIGDIGFTYFYPQPLSQPARELYRVYWQSGQSTYFALIAAAAVLLTTCAFALRSSGSSARATLIACAALSIVSAGGTLSSFHALNRAKQLTGAMLLDPSSTWTHRIAGQLDLALCLGAFAFITAIVLLAVALAPACTNHGKNSLGWAALPAFLAAMILIEIPVLRGHLARYHDAVAVVDANYVILRLVFAEPRPGAVSANVYGRTLYFQPSERILDLRHLDLRTARVEQTGPEGRFIVGVNTNPIGNNLLRTWTSANLEKQLGVFVGERLIDAPVIKSPITDMIILDGQFTQEQAQAVMKRLLRGGAA